MRRVRAAVAAAALAGVAVLAPTTGTLAVFTDEGDVGGSASTAFTIAAPALSCSVVGTTATVTWTAQRQPAGSTAYLTQAAATNIAPQPTVTGALATRTVTLSGAGNAYGSGLGRPDQRVVTLTVTSSLAGTSWATSATQQVTVRRSQNGTYSISCG